MPQLKTIILDYDETITPRYLEKDPIFAAAAGKILVDFHAAAGRPMTMDEAVSLAEQSVRDHGSELAIVEHLTGQSPESLFTAYHHNAFPGISQYLIADIALRDALIAQQQQGRELVILSHGPQSWVEKGIEMLGLREVFTPESIYGLDHPTVNFRRKNLAADLYADVLPKGHDLSQAALIDDAFSNIKFADALGLQTVHINHDMREIKWPQSAANLSTALKLL